VQKEMDRATLVDVSRTSLRTKVHSDLADLLTEVNVFIPSRLTVQNCIALFVVSLTVAVRVTMVAESIQFSKKSADLIPIRFSAGLHYK